MRRYILSFMIVLTLSAGIRLGLAWWPSDAASQPAADHHTMVAAMAAETNTIHATTAIPTAEAAVFPGIPGGGSRIAPEEMEVLKNLRQMKEKLDARAAALDVREKAVVEAEGRAAKRIEALEQLSATIQDQLQQEQGISDKKIKRLASVYDGMKANKAAPVIAKLDTATVVKVFANMKSKQVGKILSFMKPDMAVKLSKALTEKISALQQ